MTGQVLVDARGMRCPWPALRAARAAREAAAQADGVSAILTVLADDPIAPAELRKLADERGWRFAADPADPTRFLIHLNFAGVP